MRETILATEIKGLEHEGKAYDLTLDEQGMIRWVALPGHWGGRVEHAEQRLVQRLGWRLTLHLGSPEALVVPEEHHADLMEAVGLVAEIAHLSHAYPLLDDTEARERNLRRYNEAMDEARRIAGRMGLVGDRFIWLHNAVRLMVQDLRRSPQAARAGAAEYRRSHSSPAADAACYAMAAHLISGHFSAFGFNAVDLPAENPRIQA